MLNKILYIVGGAVGGAVIGVSPFLFQSNIECVTLVPSWATCINSYHFEVGPPYNGTQDDHELHSHGQHEYITGLACDANSEKLTYADFNSTLLEAQQKVKWADDDLAVSFDLAAVDIMPGSKIESAKLRVWSYPSDNPSVIQAGKWQDMIEHRPPFPADDEVLGTVNPYGEAAPGLPGVYSNSSLVSDVELAAGGQFVVWLQTMCTDQEGVAVEDCGALIDRVDLVLEFTPASD